MPDRTLSSAEATDREFEIVLGNKQLFSLLFVVFVLLGVFFAMGYVMGRSTLPADSASRRPASGEGIVPGYEDRTSSPKPTAARAEQRDADAPQQARAVPPETEAGKPSVETAKRAPVTEDAPSAALTIIEPKPGQTWLQVSAVGKPEAELLVEVLVKKGFRAAIAAGPAEKVYRVLVGPTRDDTDLARLRSELEQAGFRPIPRRY